MCARRSSDIVCLSLRNSVSVGEGFEAIDLFLITAKVVEPCGCCGLVDLRTPHNDSARSRTQTSR